MESNSNKQSTHRYGFFYDLLLNYLYHAKGKPINLLEIGVSQYENGSLPVWSKSEWVARAVGVDIQDVPEGAIEKTAFYKLDAYNRDTVDHLREVEGAKFDVIIHDGHATKEHQAFFLDNYIDLLSEIGYLVCEDVDSTVLIMEQCKEDTVFVIDGWANRGVNIRGYNDPNFLSARGTTDY